MASERVNGALQTAWLFAKGVYDQIAAPDKSNVPLPAAIRGVARWTLVLYRELERHKAFSKAAALAYTTLIALVPLLVLSFAVLNYTGLLDLESDSFERLVFGTFLGDIPQVRQVLLPGLSTVNFGAVGVIGTLGWLWVCFRIYMIVEATFSEIFHVRVTRSLPWRVTSFFLLLSVGPIAIALLLFGSIEFANRSGIPHWNDLTTIGLPILMVTCLIKLMPSTHVRWGPAIAGGLVSGMLVQAGGVGFALYLDMFATRDPLRLLYGSLGVFPVFLLWLWLLWIFVILGAEVAHVAQNYRSLMRAELEQRRAQVERLRTPSVETALEVASVVAWYARRNRAPVDSDTVADRCRIPQTRVSAVLEVLQQGGILKEVGEDWWTLARDPDAVLIGEIVDIWRRATTLRRGAADPLTTHLGEVLRATFEGTLTDASERWVDRERTDGTISMIPQVSPVDK